MVQLIKTIGTNSLNRTTLIPALLSGERRLRTLRLATKGSVRRPAELHFDPEALHESVDDGAQQVRREHPEPVADFAAADGPRPTGGFLNSFFCPKPRAYFCVRTELGFFYKFLYFVPLRERKR